MRHLYGLMLVLACTSSAAHGLLLDAQSTGDAISGTAYYTNGDRAAQQSVVLRDLSNGRSEPITTQTDTDGNFTFSVKPSVRYRVSVYGDEGHQVDVDLTAATSAQPVLVETSSEEVAFWPPPAWAVLGGGLLLSLIPAALLRRRARTRVPA